MSKKTSMGIRLDPEDRKTLEELAVKWNLNAADIVRMAIKSLLDEAQANDGKIELPFEVKLSKHYTKKNRKKDEWLS